MSDKNLAGLNALVTGAGRGIGKEIALALGREGANLSVHYLRSKDGAFETVDALLNGGVQAMAIQADLCSGRDIASLVKNSVEKLGSIDILVNNAGAIIQPGHWEHLSDEIWDQTLNINLKSAFQLIKSIAPGMRERQQGTIVNIASLYGILGAAPVIAYTTAKAGLMNLTRSLAKDLAPYVRVNAVAPGTIDTDMARAAGEGCIASVVQATP